MRPQAAAAAGRRKMKFGPAYNFDEQGQFDAARNRYVRETGMDEFGNRVGKGTLQTGYENTMAELAAQQKGAEFQRHRGVQGAENMGAAMGRLRSGQTGLDRAEAITGYQNTFNALQRQRQQALADRESGMMDARDAFYGLREMLRGSTNARRIGSYEDAYTRQLGQLLEAAKRKRGRR